MGEARSKCSRSGHQRRGIILARRVAGFILSCPRDWRPDISSRRVVGHVSGGAVELVGDAERVAGVVLT